MEASMRGGPAESHLPLTTMAFEILLALSAGEAHGYAILQDIEARTGGRMRPHAGTLYRAIGRLVDQGLLDELEGSAPVEDERRRYYALSTLGRRVAEAETRRLADQVAAARARRLVRGTLP
jgi:DNA-binding PadR family transcriptional regulator